MYILLNSEGKPSGITFNGDGKGRRGVGMFGKVGQSAKDKVLFAACEYAEAAVGGAALAGKAGQELKAIREQAFNDYLRRVVDAAGKPVKVF